MEMSTMMSQAQPPAAPAAGIPATPRGTDGETQQAAEHSAFAALLVRQGGAVGTGQKADLAAEPAEQGAAAAKEEEPAAALDAQAIPLLAMLQLVQLPMVVMAAPAMMQQVAGEQAQQVDEQPATAAAAASPLAVQAMVGGADRPAVKLVQTAQQQQGEAVLPQGDSAKSMPLTANSADISKEPAVVASGLSEPATPAPTPALPALNGTVGEPAVPERSVAEALGAKPAGWGGEKVLQSVKPALLLAKPVNGAGRLEQEPISSGQRGEGGKDGGDKALVKVEVLFNDSSAGRDSADEGGGNQLPNRDSGANIPIHARGMQLPAAPALGQGESQLPAGMDKTALHDSVMAQVKDALVSHDSKGNSQVTIRLNPAELGELRINVRLEDQRLKVEVVSENRQVREALLGNLDSLKETLMKQHLNMERFTVATGSGSGFQGFQQTNQEQNLPGQSAYRPFVMATEEEDMADTAGRYPYEQRDNALVDLRL